MPRSPTMFVFRTPALPMALVLVAGAAWPCATVDPSGLQTKVFTEKAIIAFDAATQTEHFIRVADFNSHGAPFGFIVPTPSPPSFAEADMALFSQLDAAWEALRPDEHHLELGSVLLLSASRSAPHGAVQVLQETRVAGMDVVVVKADEGAALTAWFEQNGFDMRPAVRAWVDAYVARGFVFSAFRYPGGRMVGSKAVRISFSTPVPVYPYLEPEDSKREGGLQLWVVAPEARAWTESGTAADLPSVLLRTNTLALPPALDALFAGKKTVTMFHDARFVRPRTDVQFVVATADDRDEVLPPPRLIPVLVPVECVCPAVFLLIIVVLVLRKRKRAA